MIPFGTAIVLGAAFLTIVAVVLWTQRRDRRAPQVAPEAPGPSETTDIIARLPLLFGKPVRHRYDPEEFEAPLECVTCHLPILPKAEFWEIPILNDERPDALLAVCLQCDSRSPYDKLED